MVDELASVFVFWVEGFFPEVAVHAFDDVAGLEFEEGVFVCYVDEFVVALASAVCYDCERGIAFLAVFTDDAGVVVGVGGEEVFWVVVAVYDDFA